MIFCYKANAYRLPLPPYYAGVMQAAPIQKRRGPKTLSYGLKLIYRAVNTAAQLLFRRAGLKAESCFPVSILSAQGALKGSNRRIVKRSVCPLGAD